MRRGTEAARLMGEDLRMLRISKNMSMRKVALRIGVPAATISQVEKGQRALKEPRIDDWAEALEVDKRDLRRRWWMHDTNHPAPLLVRERHTAIKERDLATLVASLTSNERSRVQGYVEAIIEQRTPTNQTKGEATCPTQRTRRRS